MRADRLALPATLPWRRNRVFKAPGDATLSDFHLRHHGRAVLTAEPRRATGEQLLGAKCGDNCELVGGQMRWTGDHATPPIAESCRGHAVAG